MKSITIKNMWKTTNFISILRTRLKMAKLLLSIKIHMQKRRNTLKVTIHFWNAKGFGTKHFSELPFYNDRSVSNNSESYNY